jgi:hypothetical protein
VAVAVLRDRRWHGEDVEVRGTGSELVVAKPGADGGPCGGGSQTAKEMAA